MRNDLGRCHNLERLQREDGGIDDGASYDDGGVLGFNIDWEHIYDEGILIGVV